MLAFAAYAAVHLAAPAALGAGDVKLAAPLGAVLGGVSWEALVVGGVLAATRQRCRGGACCCVVAGPRGARCRTARRCSLAGLLVAAAAGTGPWTWSRGQAGG